MTQAYTRRHTAQDFAPVEETTPAPANGIWVYDQGNVFADIQPNDKKFEVRCQHTVGRQTYGFSNAHIKTFAQARAIAMAYIAEHTR